MSAPLKFKYDTLQPHMIRADAAKANAAKADAAQWRRFLTNTPPLDELIEIRRLHDNKTILRRRADLPASFSPGDAEWRLA